MINLLRRAWDALDTFKQAYPENWHEEDQQVLDDLMQADLNLSGGEFDRFIPPQREWQGLTDEDREAIDKWIEFKEAGGNEPVPAQKLVTYVESKLREKNTK